jgi:N-acetylated-alpha-linked acidic dipeptidase
VNRKLISFERGFIDEGGIKDREWYRHLAVAPGKWLGYGATTMPAITGKNILSALFRQPSTDCRTEAITIDKNTAAAMVESERLSKLLDAMVESLQV